MTTPIRAPGRQPGVVRSTLVAAAAAATALLLGRTALDWAARDAEAFATSGDLPVDGLVALLAVSAGAVAAGVLTAGCALLAGAGLARLVGRSVRTTARAARLSLVIGRRLDRAGSRLTPLVVRRALVIGIGAGLGLAGPATVATADEVDLGWAVTSTVDPAAVPATGPTPTTPNGGDAPATSIAGPSDDAAWAAWPVSSGSTRVASPPAADPTPAPSPGPGAADVARSAAEDATTDAAATAGPDAAPSVGGNVLAPSADPTAPVAATTAVAATAGAGTAAEPPSTAADVPPAAATGSGTTSTPTAMAAVGAPERTDAVVVRPGDSLWSIAEASLGPGASDELIAQTWPRWHAANRALIGADPDLIHPGQELAVPGDDLNGAPLQENP
jgi:LysM repeat protein